MKIHKIIVISFFAVVLLCGIALFLFIKMHFQHTFNVKVYDANTKKSLPYSTVIFSYMRGLSGECDDGKKYFTTDKDGSLSIKTYRNFCMNRAYAPGYSSNGIKDVISSEIYLSPDSNSSFPKVE